MSIVRVAVRLGACKILNPLDTAQGIFRTGEGGRGRGSILLSMRRATEDLKNQGGGGDLLLSVFLS